jgi:uncharacterized protein YoxC
MTPDWVPPTMAISLAIIALSFLTIGTSVLIGVLLIMKQVRRLKAHLEKVSVETRAVADRLKGELEGFVDLSTETRGKVRTAIDSVETRLKDIDALVEVLHEEAEETALDVAAFVRTARHAGGVLGTARKMMRRRARDD